jgi:CheY-like chemotaxis protein
MNILKKPFNSPVQKLLHYPAGGSLITPDPEWGAGISRMTGKQPVIVVIDDSRASLSMYQRGVESLAVELTTFESPREGFEHLRDRAADLVFLGNLMRETDGLSLLRKLRELERHTETPVVVMSTKDYDQDRAIAKKLGVLEYLIKPVRSQEIREVIEKYTGAKRRDP